MEKHMKSDTIQRKSKKMKISYVVLIVVGILTIAFTVACMWLFYLFQSVPDTLVTAFYASVVGELGVSAWIKVTKTKTKKDGDENDI